MQKVIALILGLSAMGWGAIGALTIPHEIDSAAIPKVIYIDQNNDSIINRVNEIKDTVNGLSAGTAAFSGLTASRLMSTNASRQAASVSDLTSWIAGTANQITSTSDGDGTLTLSLPSAITLPGTLAVPAVVANQIAYGDGSNRLAGSGNLTWNGTTLGVTGAGTYSSTLGVTGAITSNASASGTGSAFVASSAAPTITWVQTAGGTNEKNWDIQANTASLDFRTRTDANASGVTWLSVGRSGTTVTTAALTGNQTISGTLGVSSNITQTAGTSAFTVDDNAATAWEVQQGTNDYLRVTTTNSSEAVAIGNTTTNPAINFLGSGTKTIDGTINTDLTASRTVITDGSGNLSVNTETGTGSHVRATSPTLVTPALGVAAATSIALGGNEAFTYDEGTFTATLTGVSGSVTGTARYTRVGTSVTLFLPALQGTSNSAGTTITGFPVGIRPARNQYVPIKGFLLDNGNHVGTGLSPFMRIDTGGAADFGWSTDGSTGYTIGSAFTASGTKGIYEITITYSLL